MVLNKIRVYHLQLLNSDQDQLFKYLLNYDLDREANVQFQLGKVMVHQGRRS